MALKSSDVLTEEAVRDRVEEIATPNQMFRAIYRPLDATGIDSDNIKVPKPTDTLGDPEAIAEGAEFPRDKEGYVKIPIDFQKYGFETPITQEAMDDSMIDIAADHVDRQARRMAEFMNEVAFYELSGNYHEGGAVGAVNENGKLDYFDVKEGVSVLRSDLFNPDLFITNVEGEKDLATSDEFLKANELGGTTVREGVVGRVAGMDVMVSNAGHMSTEEGEGYLVDTTYYGYEATRIPVSTNQYNAPERQAEMLQIWTRKGWKAIEPNAAVKVVG